MFVAPCAPAWNVEMPAPVPWNCNCPAAPAFESNTLPLFTSNACPGAFVPIPKRVFVLSHHKLLLPVIVFALFQNATCVAVPEPVTAADAVQLITPAVVLDNNAPFTGGAVVGNV